MKATIEMLSPNTYLANAKQHLPEDETPEKETEEEVDEDSRTVSARSQLVWGN